MKSKRYAICAILAGVLAYGVIDLGCDSGTGTPRGPFPLPDAGGINMGPGAFDGGQMPHDATSDGYTTPPPADASSFPGDGGF